MAEQKQDLRTLSIDVSLSGAHLAALDNAVQEGLPLTRKLGGIATSLLCDLAGGGLVVPPEVMSRITAMTGEITSAKQLIPFIEKGVNLDDGSPCGKWRMDPTYMPYWEEVAAANGITVHQMIQSLCDYFVDSGWLNGSVIPGAEELIRIRLTPEQYKSLQETLGKDHVTGADIMELVGEQVKEPALGG
jgi:hypothetical protein